MLGGYGRLSSTDVACSKKFLLPLIKVSRWPKSLDNFSLRTHNSSLEGARKLKFAPFCSP